MDDTNHTLVDAHYASALVSTISKLRSKINEIERPWKNCVLGAFEYLEETANDALGAQNARAVKLHIEMQRDLFDFMPFFSEIYKTNELSEVCPGEPRRVKEQIYASARLIEWLLFRKCGAQPEEIEKLFNWRELERLTGIYCRVLQTVATDIHEILGADSLPEPSASKASENLTSSSVPYLNLVKKHS
ncbi:MAG: hypothetical protein CFH41_01019 [Alphaproteobacteria bacterium MarineAlpha11_Bin1]|mgnify:CR=1 FL=1|nr:MAG: hypothetical protein CFH41_01019 [Alphaproteobacteria bacterium MarineAlpha11_Bin1]|tara:strand:+ start:8591 stop:9157 length:567 start_codon:yes stop_codon:yes gene_type:complete